MTNYGEKRAALIVDAEQFIAEGKFEEAEKITQEIKALDESQEKEIKAQANLEVLKAHKPTRVENLVCNPAVANAGEPLIIQKQQDDEQEAYKNAFGAFLMGKPLDSAQQSIFNKFNGGINNVQTASQNSVVVPNTLQSEIFRKMADLHPILSDLKDYGVRGNMTIAVDDAQAPTDDGFYEETDAPKEDSDKMLVEVNLAGYELKRMISVSYKLKNMSIPDYIDYVIEKLSERLGNALAISVIQGKGVPASGDSSFKPQPLGIITSLESEASKPQVIESANITESDIRALISKIKSGYLALSCMYANNNFIWNTLAGLKDDTGKYYFVADPTSGGVGRLFGVVVKEEAAIPDNTLVLGAVGRAYAYNAQAPISITQEDRPTLSKIYYVGYTLLDGKPITNKAFAVLKKK